MTPPQVVFVAASSHLYCLDSRLKAKLRKKSFSEGPIFKDKLEEAERVCFCAANSLCQRNEVTIKLGKSNPPGTFTLWCSGEHLNPTNAAGNGSCGWSCRNASICHFPTSRITPINKQNCNNSAPHSSISFLRAKMLDVGNRIISQPILIIQQRVSGAESATIWEIMLHAAGPKISIVPPEDVHSKRCKIETITWIKSSTKKQRTFRVSQTLNWCVWFKFS